MTTFNLFKALKNHISILFLTGVSLTYGITSSFAAFSIPGSWHPVFAVGAGVSSAKVGAVQEFAIINQLTDEFYYYSGAQESQTSGLLDILLNAEWNLNADWMLQAGLDYNRTEPFLVNSVFLQGADAESSDSYLYRYNVKTNQFLVNSKLLYSLKNRFHPYVFGGLGAAFNKAYKYTTNVPTFITFTRNYYDNSNTNFSYALGVGIDTDVTPNMRVGIGYRYTDLGKVSLGNSFIDLSAVPGTLTQSNLHVNEFLVQLTWVFA